MRKIVASLFLSLDGVQEAPDEWMTPYMDEQAGSEILSQLNDADSLLLGRVTYETFADAFADDTDDPFAVQMNSIHKYVVSTTLDKAGWQNSTLISHDALTQIAELRQRPGKDIWVSGSATLVRALLREGLLDELRLMIFPLTVGRGDRFFTAGGSRFSLKLTASQTFGTGVLAVRYGRAK
jgi:dihydrofolate reductase